MKRAALALTLCLAACGPKGSDLTLTASGVTMAEVGSIRAELSGLKGVSEVRAGNFRDGQVTFAVKFDGKGTDLAARLSSLASGLKNVKGFDDQSVQVAYGAPPTPVGGLATAGAAPEESKPGGAKPAPSPPEERKPISVEVKKDPLAYKVQQLAGGTIATFDNWKVTPVPGDGTWATMETHPEGKENDFQMIVSAGTPGREVMNNLFEEARKFLQQMMPTLKAAGEPQKTTIGGDEARVQDYTIDAQGRKLKVQSIIIRKKDVAVSVLALGTDEAFKEFGRAVGITAQSITIKEEPPDARLVGTWLLEKYTSSGAGTSSQFSYSSSRSLTLYPNATFTESSSSSVGVKDNVGRTDAYLDGGDRGRVVKRGTTLSFIYDNGKVWNTEFKFDGGAVWFGGNLWMKQQ
jgi:acylphosphatase